MNRRLFLLYTSFFAAGCATAPTRQTETNPSIAKIRLAITDSNTLADLTDYEPFRQALATALATDVEFFPLDSQVAVAIALKQGQVDLVLAGPSEYVITSSRTNAVPMLGITRPNYYAILAVPPGSPIKTIADLRGKTIAMSDVGSTSGHLGPTKMLIDAGLDPTTDVTIQMLGDEGSIQAIEQGKVDAWAGSTSDYQAELIDRFPKLAQSPLLPGDVFIASSSLAPATVELLRSRMLQHQPQLIQAIATHKKKYQGSSFKLVQDADYNPIRDTYQTIGQGDFITPPSP